MSYTPTDWENLPTQTSPLNKTNLQKMDNQIATNDTNITTNASDISALDTRVTTAEGDIESLQTEVDLKTLTTSYIISADNALSCNSTFSNLGNTKTLEVKKGNTVVVMARVGGLYISNTGYSIVIDAYADDTTASSTGAANMYTSWTYPAMSGDANRTEATLCFCFTGLSKGNHTFRLKWRTNNSAAIGYMGQYGGAQIVLFEV